MNLARDLLLIIAIVISVLLAYAVTIPPKITVTKELPNVR